MSLSILLFLPVLLSLFATQLPTRYIGRASALLSVIPLGIAIDYIARFNPGNPGLQFVTDKLWVSSLGIHYKLGISGLNVALVLLTTILFTVSLAWSSQREIDRPRLYYFHFGFAQSAVLGAFMAQDLILFVAFFDLMLIPFYFLVGSWGTGQRVRATIKMVIYTAVGSFLMLAAAVAAGVLASNEHGTAINFTFSALEHLGLSAAHEDWIFLCFAAAFLVKMPLTPFHGWLPDAYKSMPIPAVAVFSGVLSKVAAYGFIAIVLPLFPQASHHYQTLMLVIALVSVLWGTAMAFTTRDARLVIAYSSIAQLGFIVLGIFSLKPRPGGQGRAVADGEPRHRHRRLVLCGRRCGRARRWQREARRHGRHRLPRSAARQLLPDHHVREPGDAGLLELHRRVHDPAGGLLLAHVDRTGGEYRRGRGRLLRTAPLHHRDAQPCRWQGQVVRAEAD